MKPGPFNDVYRVTDSSVNLLRLIEQALERYDAASNEDMANDLGEISIDEGGLPVVGGPLPKDDQSPGEASAAENKREFRSGSFLKAA